MQIAWIAVLAWGLYYLQRKIYEKYWNRNLEVFIRFEKEQIVEDEVTYLEEIIENSKWLLLPMVFLKFKLPKSFQASGENGVVNDDHLTRNEMMSVMMKQSLRRRVELSCSKRGKYEIGQVVVMAKSLFLDEEYRMELICDSKITVYPRTVNVKKFERLLQSIQSTQQLSGLLQEDPFTIRGVREYQIYDNIKRINWGATAKTGEMKVNLLETEASQNGFVFLNVQKESFTVHNEVLEESIRLAKTFCAAFTRKRIRSGLWTNGTNGKNRKPICVEHLGVGEEHMSQINEALTQINLKESGAIYQFDRKEELDFVKIFAKKIEEKSNQGLLILISNNQDIALKRLLYHLKKKGRPFLWIVPVDNVADYREERNLREHMRIWRMNYETKEEV